jgi:hypothetical protein
MLRLLESAHRGTVLIPVSINVASSGVTFNYGKSLFATATRGSAGNYTLTLKNPMSRASIAVGSVYLTSGAGARPVITFTNTSTITVSTLDSTGAALEPCAVDFLILGWMKNEYDKYSGKLFPVMAPMLSPRILFGEVSSAGAATIGAGDFTISKTSTGTYSVTFRKDFSQNPIIVGMGYDDGTVTSVSVKSKSASGCVLEVYGHSADALVDGTFSLLVMGSQGVGECGHDSLRQVLSTQRNCRISGLSVAALSSATIAVGGPTTGLDFSSSSAASANATFNITDSYRRSCVFIANGVVAIARRGGGTSSSTQIGIKTADVAGSATDDGIKAIVIGSDDPSEYFSAN